LIELEGQTTAQVSFAKGVRLKKLKEWSPDLPARALRSLYGIADATWWLANLDNSSASIGWPASWVDEGYQPPKPQRRTPPAAIQEQMDGLSPQPPARKSPPTDIDKFDAFARKACQSPELAYLTMMALLFRQTQDAGARAKFQEVRAKIQDHLDAIDQIADL
jgi:hypothetical protein